MLLALLLMFLQWPDTHNWSVSANEIPVDVVELTILVSNESAQIEFVQADVIFNITASPSQASFSVDFWAHHLFYNRNDTKTIPVAFPFRPSGYDDFPREELVKINVSNQPVPFIYLPKTPLTMYSDLPEDDIRKQYQGYLNAFFLFNVTFTGEAETTIDVNLSGEFTIDVEFRRDAPESVTFYYIAGSAHCWDWRNMTERVQFITWERQADFYSPQEFALVSEGERNGVQWGNYSWVFPNPFWYCEIRLNNPEYQSKSFSSGSFMVAVLTLIIISHRLKK
jgi:hypothetical protein